MKTSVLLPSHSKCAAEWGRIVDSHYARRDVDGLVVAPNWAVMQAHLDHEGEWVGAVCIDICPALLDEIAGPSSGPLRSRRTDPVVPAAVGRRLGYDRTQFGFELDWTGVHTAAFIRATRS